MKINNTGKDIDELLQKKLSLDRILQRIVNMAQKIIKRLPIKPGVIIADGGITRAEKILTMQSAISKIKIERQRIFDGTALGVAKMIIKK
ncbi:MAG: Glycerol kinase [Candidatus Doudnabacteria bacterium Gr01-1014_77]|uniref:Glycerol kinase n=1 Tax=Candidatus Doudnabacteria bacterium Gr01-1014_77 TaxID=2017133 RepID=A0A554JCS0_9BACT|nr:MAG: Glycerol kinase [Candidatus Doudnabacteria bacterium Gr01-1014_77]